MLQRPVGQGAHCGILWCPHPSLRYDAAAAGGAKPSGTGQSEQCGDEQELPNTHASPPMCQRRGPLPRACAREAVDVARQFSSLLQPASLICRGGRARGVLSNSLSWTGSETDGETSQLFPFAQLTVWRREGLQAPGWQWAPGQQLPATGCAQQHEAVLQSEPRPEARSKAALSNARGSDRQQSRQGSQPCALPAATSSEPGRAEAESWCVQMLAVGTRALGGTVSLMAPCLSHRSLGLMVWHLGVLPHPCDPQAA